MSTFTKHRRNTRIIVWLWHKDTLSSWKPGAPHLAFYAISPARNTQQKEGCWMLETSGLNQGADNRVLLLLAAFQASPQSTGSTSAHCVTQISQQLLSCLLRNASPESPGALLTQKSSNLKTSGTKQDGPSFQEMYFAAKPC